ncbi:MAG: methionine adenosyltransferase [Candidatus Fonsibacter ubiquis]|jgi:S-adenosylmethionine synthetase|nr:methionine adenosyltransferase [Candidatus Fonsibacter ubiquis]NCU69393.1 methionine adenosyltransferase [Candidatus Fonsibacter ubiquis]GBL33782.1 S-adenosylmethionine synthase [Pelagibacterales bacterium]HRD24122.1 methionine adenosyltransferase [Candidatus Fonsibacter ubiquis]
MAKQDYIFTSESVSEGHPDKVCDIISDSVLDLYLSKFPESRVACETLVTTNTVVIAGEVRGPEIKSDEIEKLIRNRVKDIGYEQEGFHWKNLKFTNYLHSQSQDIAVGVDSSGNKDEGAGDQGIMFGFACTETKDLMPAPISYSHKVLQLMSEARKSGKEKLLRPDSKSQFSVIYEKGKPKGISSIVVSTQHDESVDQEKVKEIVRPYVLSVIPKGWMCDENNFYVNPTGRFVIGGPDGDTGLTGRKIIVDTYGGAAPHGGGAFSGKDPTKVDRSAAYVARYLAKNIVAAGVSEKCLIQLSYAIGVSQPLSIYIDLFDGEDKKSKKIEEIISKNFNLSPRGIRELLKLNKPIYKKTAAYGHFGRQSEDDGSFSWEKTDLIKYFQSKV